MKILNEIKKIEKLILFYLHNFIIYIKGFNYGYLEKPENFSPTITKIKFFDALYIKKIKDHIQGKMLVMRLDAIGDYILFRNFLVEIKKTEEYKKYKITLCGNIIWKEIAVQLDCDYVDNYIWIELNKFTTDFKYRKKKFKEINNNKFEITIVSNYSRDFLLTDSLVFASCAKRRIGFETDLSNITYFEKNISDKYYSELIQSDKNPKFEFYRNKEFFEKFLNFDINICAPFINTGNLNFKNLIYKNYAIIFPGASDNKKIWDSNNFYIIAKYLQEKYNLNIIICGGINDKIYSTKINKSRENFIDLAGSTNLIELIFLISRAKILISNDTSAVHMAGALNIKTICLSNGSHYGRFIPYPREIKNDILSLYPLDIMKNSNNYELLYEKYMHSSELNINEISIEDVILSINKLLNE